MLQPTQQQLYLRQLKMAVRNSSLLYHSRSFIEATPSHLIQRYKVAVALKVDSLYNAPPWQNAHGYHVEAMMVTPIGLMSLQWHHSVCTSWSSVISGRSSVCNFHAITTIVRQHRVGICASLIENTTVPVEPHQCVYTYCSDSDPHSSCSSKALQFSMSAIHYKQVGQCGHFWYKVRWQHSDMLHFAWIWWMPLDWQLPRQGELTTSSTCWYWPSSI